MFRRIYIHIDETIALERTTTIGRGRYGDVGQDGKPYQRRESVLKNYSHDGCTEKKQHPTV